MSLLSGIKTGENEIEELRNVTANGGYIGLAQINLIAGDLESNSLKIAKYIKYAESVNLDMVIFPELAIIGYSMHDTIERHPFIIDENVKWLKSLAELTGKTAALVGFIEPRKKTDEGKKYYNSLAVLRNGKIEEIIRNSFSADKIIPSTTIYSLNGIKYGITIGEDLWNDKYFFEKTMSSKDSVSELKNAGADVIINCSASSTRTGKKYLKTNLLSSVSSFYKIPIIYVNQVGAIDNSSFDGTSCGVNSHGDLFAMAKSFEEDFIILNPMKSDGEIEPIATELQRSFTEQKSFTLKYDYDLERTYKTIIQGIRDYFSKCGLKRAVLGLSGGLDSSICAVLLADALGKENVFGVSMPSKLTSVESKSDAKALACNLGINYTELSIKQMVETTSGCLNQLFEDVETKWQDRYTTSFTSDNIQARARAIYLWGISNEFPSCIPIATSDKSELYMGYATINGDMSGGFAPIADVPKTKLFALARWLNLNRKSKNTIPKSVIEKKPGAELVIDPKTGKPLKAEDALMPYEFLDEIIWRIENKSESYKDLLNTKFVYENTHVLSRQQKVEWLDKFYNRMSKALYKWSILPPSVIVEIHSINKAEYVQPITTGNINYKGQSIAKIKQILSDS